MSENADVIASLAIGALPPAEARLVSQALERNPALEAEAEAYRQTARHMMEAFPAVDPGPDVWAGIERSLTGRRRRRPRRPSMSLTWAWAAAAVVVLIAASALYLSGSARSPAAAAEALAAAPGSRTLVLTDPSSEAEVASLVIGADGTSYFVGAALEDLGAGRTYQLWSVVDGEVVSAGLLGSSPGVVALRIEADPTVLAVTAERAGGVAVSNQDPIAAWTVEG